MVKSTIKKEDNKIINKGVTIRIRRFLVQIAPGARPGSGSQPCYEVPGDLHKWLQRSD